MSRTVFESKHFMITHTVETRGKITKLRDNHYEDTCLITILVCGKGRAFVEGSIYNIESGDIITSSDREIHCFKFDDTDVHERMSVNLSNSILADFVDYNVMLTDIFNSHALGANNLFPRDKFFDSEIQSVVRRACDLLEIEEKKNTHIAELRILIVNLLLKMYDYYKMRMITGNDNLCSHSVISDICRYINENISENLTYKEIENRFFVSRYYLSEVFKRNTGMPFTEYVIYKRIKAVDSFVSEGIPLMLAAERAGFGNYSHFYKKFMKYRKISPTKYYSKKE